MFIPLNFYKHKNNEILFMPRHCSMNDETIYVFGSWHLDNKTRSLLSEDNIEVKIVDFKNWEMQDEV